MPSGSSERYESAAVNKYHATAQMLNAIKPAEQPRPARHSLARRPSAGVQHAQTYA